MATHIVNSDESGEAVVRQSLLRFGVLTPDLTEDVVLLADVERVTAGGVHLGSLERARTAVKAGTRRLVVHSESRADLVGGVALAVPRGADDGETCFFYFPGNYVIMIRGEGKSGKVFIFFQ